MPNMRILAQAVLKISCCQVFSIVIMAESKKDVTLSYTVRPKKKIRVRLYLVLMLHIKFQVPSSSGSLVFQPTKGITDRRKDGQK